MSNTCIEKKNIRILVIGLILAGMCVLFAAWQGSVSNSLDRTFSVCEAKVCDLQEQNSALRAKVAKLETTEYVSAQASVSSDVTLVAHAK